jgi:tight adherence protein C
VSGAALGGLLGLAAGAGLMLAISARPRRPGGLDRRLAPYLSDTLPPCGLLAPHPDARPTLATAARRLLAPVLPGAVRAVDRLVGGRGSVRRRLAALGSDRSIEDFRTEQVLCGAAGLTLGTAAAVPLVLGSGRLPLPALALLPVAGLLTGVLARDWTLSRRVRRRQAAVLAEFPVVAELLALAVTAGEGPVGAIDRVCRLTGGEIARDLADALARTRAGAPLALALEQVRDRTGVAALARFIDGVVVALERGTPLADLLRAQAADVREAGKRALLEAGGRREIAMLVPVVFGILPVTVLFALYPGLVSITALTG